MSKKKKRQRGTRTHSSGSQKNRRGAGNRGGRGAAGRKDHEKQLYGPLGKDGFKRPESTKVEVETVNVSEIDEDLALLLAEDVAEETDDGDGAAVDARDLVEDGHEVDAVKVLGGGRVHEALSVTADAFSDSAREAITDAGGEVTVTERGRRLRSDGDETESTSEDDTGN